ncbi:hypothetical protein F0562_028657 [Nyssa sinensis]|uniref:Alpha/beta hydrolase fold-3 domain-containing protein n=1 Tax=Nyssa sinensis TaxID=561372 RepID=A0A5J5B0K6_9ASTE|nr:hypothetical protein F0562_028657 [Nyssa sinensis]
MKRRAETPASGRKMMSLVETTAWESMEFKNIPIISEVDVSPLLKLFKDKPVLDLQPFMKLYKNNTVERLQHPSYVPPSSHPETEVQSKDIVIAPETGVCARLYIPDWTNPDHKLPLLVYFHGGGFITGSAFYKNYHDYLNSIVAAANVVAVSVNYRLAPENPLPIAYDDSWDVIKWVASHSKGCGDEEWLNQYVDFERVFYAGDSSGGNIAHNMAMRVGSGELDGAIAIAKPVGIVLIHPYFWGKKPIGKHEPRHNKNSTAIKNLWLVASKMGIGLNDPRVNPLEDPRLSSLGCTRVLVCIAELDWLRDRGWYYAKALRESGWGGKVEVLEAKGENHVFHLRNSTSDNVVAMLKRVVSFINDEDEI